jgi:SpoIIAA-like
MIQRITDVPSYVAGFEASGEVTKADYETIVMPAVKDVVTTHGHIHFLLVLKTDVGNYTIGAWWEDVLLGLKNITSWKKMAIVSDQEGVKKFTDVFSVLVPGESKGFGLNQVEEAKVWVSTE